jgi:hypothetical protein
MKIIEEGTQSVTGYTAEYGTGGKWNVILYTGFCFALNSSLTYRT